MIERKVREHLENEKVASLLRRLDMQGLPEADSDFAELLYKLTRTTAHMTPKVEDAAKIIR